MLITKFNRMIRSRIVWGCFAVIVCVSFVGTGMSLRGTGRDAHGPDTLGTLYGKPVSREEFAKARFFELGMRHDAGNLSEKKSEELEKRVWKRIAVLRAAAKMDITVPDSEIRDLIQSEPGFATGGVFDKERYRNIIESSRGVRVDTFEEYLRQQLVITRTAADLAAMTWTPPAEIDEQVADLSDSFTIRYVAITTNNLDSQVTVSREDARKFFDEHMDMFEIPEKRAVRYVAFPVTNYMAGLTADNDDIQDYYYSHTNDFSTLTTNDTFVLKPLTNVEDEVRDILIHRQAVAAARRVATTFEMAMASGRSADAMTMEAAAAAQGLTIRTSGLFSLNQPVPGLDAGTDLNRAAFKLTDDPDGYFSGAITGVSNVYVVATHTNVPAHFPDFEDAFEDVLPVATGVALRTALDEKATEVHDAIANGLKANNTFSNVVTELKLEVLSPEPFSLYQVRAGLGGDSMSNHFEHVSALAPAVAKLYDGDLTEPREAGDSRLIAVIEARTATVPFISQMLRPRVLDTMNGMISSAVFSDWQNDLLAKAKLEDLSGRPGDDDPEPVPDMDDY